MFCVGFKENYVVIYVIQNHHRNGHVLLTEL